MIGSGSCRLARLTDVIMTDVMVHMVLQQLAMHCLAVRLVRVGKSVVLVSVHLQDLQERSSFRSAPSSCVQDMGHVIFTTITQYTDHVATITSCW